ncbi:hypothetical protein A9Q84_16795 [Halobacteriovorax marinus]|uniref:Uncharacterized protein n=1 Tax=Halobacteriovorax marinus TaxID=97084 RepID=A0A1Y5FAB7_9BACT|nr:hypothetical protein A9Q84_16795 [Halobacteriovorax marinus]
MKTLQKIFYMTDEVWDKHSNPWSVWTRFATLPFVIAAFWSIHYVGKFSVIPIFTSIVWLWLNPRLFSKPTFQTSWASKAVLGEKVWINEDSDKFKAKHSLVLKFTTLISFSGLANLVWGVVNQDIHMTILGTIILYIGKMWFLDRMVWIYDDYSALRK